MENKARIKRRARRSLGKVWKTDPIASIMCTVKGGSLRGPLLKQFGKRGTNQEIYFPLGPQVR